MNVYPETLDRVTWKGKPIKDLTREELEQAFLEVVEMYQYEKTIIKMKLDELEKTFGGAPIPAVNPWRFWK